MSSLDDAPTGNWTLATQSTASHFTVWATWLMDVILLIGEALHTCVFCYKSTEHLQGIFWVIELGSWPSVMKQHHSWDSNNSVLGVETGTVRNLSVIVLHDMSFEYYTKSTNYSHLCSSTLHENEAWNESFWLKFIQNYTPENRAQSCISHDI